MQTLRKHRWALVVSLALLSVFGLLVSSSPGVFAQDSWNCTYTFNTSKSTVSRTECTGDALVTPNATFKKTSTDTYEFSEELNNYGYKSTCKLKLAISTDGISGTLSGTYGAKSSQANASSCVNIDSSSVSIGGVDTGGGQSGTGKCTYAYNPKRTTIARSDCTDEYKTPDAIFRTIGPRIFEHSESVTPYSAPSITCTQKISVSSGDPSKATLTGNIGVVITAGSVASESCKSLGSSNITIATSHDESGAGDPVKSAQLSLLLSKFSSLIDKHCKSDSKLPANMQYCHTGWQTAITTCFNQVFPKIDPNDKNADKKFNNQFTDCILKNLRNPPKKQTIIDALGAHAYSDLIASGEAATNRDNSTDGGDACNASGNPLTWIICPIFDGFGSLMTFCLIKSSGFLKTDPMSMEAQCDT